MALAPQKIEQIEKLTDDLLKRTYGESENITLPVDLKKVIETSELTLKFGRFKDFDVTGYYNRNDKAIYVDETMPYPRQAFTAAHELGHFYLHESTDEEVFYRRQNYDLTSAQKTVEQEANWFASSLLMPKALVLNSWKADPSLDLVAKKFGVSTQALFYRLKNIGIDATV